MVLARIDREEPWWAGKATHALHVEGTTAEITPDLREAIDEEWTWVNYPASRLSRDETRECSDQAQKIHDAIRNGRLVIHAHAHAEDSWDTVAVGTYRDTCKSVHLHGENHLCHVTGAFALPAQALIFFEQAHRKAVRLGPAPMTDTERHTVDPRTSLTLPDTAPPDTTATGQPCSPRALPHQVTTSSAPSSGCWRRRSTPTPMHGPPTWALSGKHSSRSTCAPYTSAQSVRPAKPLASPTPKARAPPLPSPPSGS
ncbi:hypothetical protein ACH4UV_20680 [Streptomyces sp. NPDC020802]|uniref:hypothetical protein n=1 Tax=Streptomyces sp. NPDC020802 TaxID=3365094 RepID=UPI0037AE4C91